MPTDNPKVSAYVPQVLKDRLKKFREERSLSESQAVTIILAEYFGITESLGRSPEAGAIGGVTLARIEAVESKLTSFEESVQTRLKELENVIQKLNEPSVVQSGSPPNLYSTDSLLGKLPVETQVETEQPSQKEGEVPVNLLGEPLDEIKLIAGVKLSELRFGLPKAAIAGAKRKKSAEEFREWTCQHDPDGIAWKYVESPSKGYIPADELPSELKSKLLEWIEKNIG